MVEIEICSNSITIYIYIYLEMMHWTITAFVIVYLEIGIQTCTNYRLWFIDIIWPKAWNCIHVFIHWSYNNKLSSPWSLHSALIVCGYFWQIIPSSWIIDMYVDLLILRLLLMCHWKHWNHLTPQKTVTCKFICLNLSFETNETLISLPKNTQDHKDQGSRQGGVQPPWHHYTK